MNPSKDPSYIPSYVTPKTSSERGEGPSARFARKHGKKIKKYNFIQHRKYNTHATHLYNMHKKRIQNEIYTTQKIQP